jgi:uncharacterized protein YabE (DUF348 family)
MSKLASFIIGIILFLCINFDAFAFWGKEKEKINFDQSAESSKKVILNDDGLVFEVKTDTATVEDFLTEQKLDIKDEDVAFPNKESKVFSNSIITLSRAKKVTILDGQEKKVEYTWGRKVEDALVENNIKLGDDDIVSPSLNSPVRDSSEVNIIRVEIKEEKVLKDIDFKKTSEEDDNLSWRINKIKQKGVKGKEEITYKVISYNGKEISRKILDRTTIQDPTPEISVQGTYVKLGKASTGAATWYAFRGGLFAANPWLPIGSYVKVTNTENGKSVIVKINDRGPFGKGRIMDLDKVAFQKIGDLGAGVINVKMEVILN